MGGVRRLIAVTALAVAGSAAIAVAPALAAAPVVVTGAAGQITYQSAVLAGTVNTGEESTEVYFQYGTSTKYGADSAPQQVSPSKATLPISIAVPGLTAGTTYHYRMVATNSTKTVTGDDKSFTTAKIPLALAITAAPNPVAFGGAVTIEGTLTGTGNAGAPVQLQQNAFPYTAGFVNVGNPELTLANGGFVFNVLGVALTTQYRVVSGVVASPTVMVADELAVTLDAHAKGTRQRPTVHFTGTITPAEPSARIAFERLVGKNWKVIGGTVAALTPANNAVSFSKTIRVYHGGFFRALVLPVEGSHVSGYTQPVLVRIK